MSAIIGRTASVNPNHFDKDPKRPNHFTPLSTHDLSAPNFVNQELRGSLFCNRDRSALFFVQNFRQTVDDRTI